MKEDIAVLIDNLPDSITGVFILLGEEAQLIDEARAAINKKTTFDMVEKADLAAITNVDSADSKILQNRGGSLFGSGACCYEIQGYGKPPDAAINALQKFAPEITAPDLLIVTIYGVEGRLLARDRKGYKTAWVRDITALGVHAVARRLDEENTAIWCRRWVAKENLSIDDNSIRWLAQHTEGNLAVAKQCLYKIKISGGSADIEYITTILSGGARYNIFHLVEAAVAGSGNKALSILNALLDINEPPTLVAWAIANAISSILATRHNQPIGGLSYNTITIIKEIARHADEAMVIDALSKIAHADRVIKGIDDGDVKIALMDAVAALACLRRGKKIPTPRLQIND